MHDKLLTYINIVLILVCGACVFYLATPFSNYSKPAEIVEMEEAARDLKKPVSAPPVETTFMAASTAETSLGAPSISIANESDPGRTPSSAVHPNLARKMPYLPFYTPTPTPTPTPAPPPPPPPLEPLTHFWQISSFPDADSVELVNTDTRQKDYNIPFTLKVGGPGHPATWTDGVDYTVKLNKIDIDTTSVILTFGMQTRTLAMGSQ